jgi:hypothetical protein
MTYAEKLAKEIGTVTLPTDGVVISDYVEREKFYDAYKKLCQEHGYQIVAERDSAPDFHDPLMIIPLEDLKELQTTLVVPLFDANGREEGWA